MEYLKNKKHTKICAHLLPLFRSINSILCGSNVVKKLLLFKIHNCDIYHRNTHDLHKLHDILV